jgi:hypothetical protein
MKKLTLLSAVFMFCLYASAAGAEPIINAVWQVDSLVDDAEQQTTYLDLDIEVGKYFLQAHGKIDLNTGAAPVHGSGYFVGSDLYIYLNCLWYSFVTMIDASLNGTIEIFGADGNSIDTGTLIFLGAE